MVYPTGGSSPSGGSPPPLPGLEPGFFLEVAMRVLKRKPVQKSSSARKFRKQTSRTKSRNMTAPMRGGIRL